MAQGKETLALKTAAHDNVEHRSYPNKTLKVARATSPSDGVSRSSFSSVRENDDGLAQTFTHSKISSYTQHPEDVFDETPSPSTDDSSQQPFFQAPLTKPSSRLQGFLYPADSFKGWREIPLKGKIASRSCEDLHKLSLTWHSPPQTPETDKVFKQLSPGKSLLEKLPTEILSSIIDLLVLEIPPNGLTTRNADLMALLLTSRSVHAATLNILYKHITIPHSRIFRKFLSTVQQYPALASIVRRLDFSHFNPSTIFSTASERARTKNLTAETLTRCLELTPYLQEFLAQEYIDDDLSAAVLRKLFFAMPQLTAVDFCGCSSTSFKNAFNDILQDEWPEALPIQRLSFHKCLSLPSSAFETILPRLPRLTHLDVAGTRITDEALMSICETARITHLNLAKCKELSPAVIVEFITTHPAVKDSLLFLSLATNGSAHQLLGADDVTTLLHKLPPTIVSLSLKGSRMDPSHISQLLPLMQSLEELALGHGLNLSDVYRLFRDEDSRWLSHNLRYLDVSDAENILGTGSALLSATTAPLHVIEVEEKAYERIAKAKKSMERAGWTTKEFGNRFWIVRMNADGTTRDNGGRPWKMGADSWGMRKIPVAVSEVGGMYGSFMFGRRL